MEVTLSCFPTSERMEINLPSPAKINLMLAVTGRREDGFHSLTSLVTPLAFGDTVHLSVSRGGDGVTIETTDPSLPVDRANIAWRAADSFLKRFPIEASIHSRIEKRIPVGAGLGGGSSNAASVLKGLASLFEVEDQGALRELAAALGSDCPLFLEPGPSVLRGRGDEIERLGPEAAQSLSGLSLVLFKPSFGISTVWAYQALARVGRYADANVAETQLESWSKGALSLEALLANSFDSVVGRKYPSIPLMLETVRRKTEIPCLMSGSGSCCFALCDRDRVPRIRACIEEGWGKRAFFQETLTSVIG